MAGSAFICASCRAARRQTSFTAASAFINRRWASTQRSRPMRLAIIGSGPAGYYVAYRVMKRLPEAFVDMYESLPTPFGLVRYGVAPDHPEVKKSAENLEDVAKWSNFNFVGNVSIGDQATSLPLSVLAHHYDAILFAYGASRDKELGVTGEQLKGVYSARAFVGWYNGLPEFAHLQPDLESGETASILGQGNVALDVARVLLTPVEELRKTDIAEHALEALSKSRIRDVSIVGRRGPLQAPATIKEIRELMSVPGSHFNAPAEGWEQHLGLPVKALPRQLKRVMELLAKPSATSSNAQQRSWQFRYLLSPSQFIGNRGGEHLEAVDFQQMQYDRPMKESLESITEDTKAMAEWERPLAVMNRIRSLGVKPSGQTSQLPASMAFRSIGYLSEPLDGMQDLSITFDKKRGIIPNDMHGRVLSPDLGPGGLSAAHVPGMYCAGWVKRGPTGVIASTLDDAFRTADILVDDWENGVAFNKLVEESDKLGFDGVKPVLADRGIRPVSWSDWERLDQEEKRRGEAKGKPREKVTNVDEMMKIIDG